MSEQTFVSIDHAMQKVVDVVPAGNSVSHLVQVWSGIKPLLTSIEMLPFFPPAWKKALAVFTAALDALGTDPAFKAGKDL
jgi:hypothetical protein